ncbi:SGNH/GDSL hydrolase family protein [Zhihengliuella salsuginis]|uniref:SGNH/GDSL hydrolase family protein n=1 Tax=Zhihengliuella salsuginis TaxID=578222 RepID=UPI0016766261|nr:SGNH/GDSL hydrolase family protein [Zhihengliuella salsuginis]
MDFEKRYVAIGDSFSEGVGDPAPDRPNGVRGWADRVAEQLIAADPAWGYANLAIRGKKLPQIVAEQVPQAIALKPTLVTISAGGNDILRPRVDVEGIAAQLDGALQQLKTTGADVVVFTGFDVSTSPIFSPTLGRVALFNERLREIADRHGIVIADYWRWREFQNYGYWDEDRLHMNTYGHRLMATRILDLLRRDHTIEVPELHTPASRGRVDHIKQNAQWARTHLLPWVQRRLTGKSSGDHMEPRYPDYVQVSPD